MDVREQPKVVLHDHLDGGLRPGTVVELAAEHGYEGLPSTDPDRLADWFDQGRSGSLTRYLAAFEHTTAVMQVPEAIERVAYESLVDAAGDGVVHLESRFAPSLLTRRGLDRMAVLEAASSGFRRAADETGASWGIIVDAMRQDTDSDVVAEVAVAATDLGVVGFDLAGPEDGFPAGRHRAACELVLAAGLGLTIHAGEAAGPDSIADALACGAERIGHGYRIVEDCVVADGEVVALGLIAATVLERRIPLEICPWSNAHTGGFTVDEHPVDLLYRAGFAVTISTDNRLMSRTSASRELATLVEVHGWGPDEVDHVTSTAVDAAFVTDEVRRRLRDQVRSVNAT